MNPPTLARVAAGLLILSGAFPGSASAWQPLKVHPQNPYILEFRGKPTLLRTFGPHYGWLFDSSLNFIPHLDVFQRDGMNLTRIWCMGYPADAPQDFLQPWQRATSGANALDGLKKWDLTTWNEAYFTRLKAIAQAASDRGIVVEFTFFSVFYEDVEWRSSPFHPSNNVQGYGAGNNRFDCMRQNSVNALLFERQLAAVRKIVKELNGFDNVYFEIQNEPFWNQPGVKDAEEVAFHNTLLAAIREEQVLLPNRHLVAHNFPQQIPAMSLDFDIINEHYPAAVPTTTIPGAEALLNNHYSRGRVLSLDETDTTTEPQTRLEAWMFFIGGGGIYDGLDAQGVVYPWTAPSGDTALGNSIRGAVRNIGTYMDRTHLVALRRNLAWVTGGKPANAILQASASPGQQYLAYLHHGRSGVTPFQLTYEPIDSTNHTVSLAVTLPAGNWRAVWTRPSDLVDIKVQQFTSTGAATALEPVTYQADVALRIDRTGQGDLTPPPQTAGLTAAPNADGSISLSWSPVPAFDAASYQIYRSDSPGVPVDAAHRVAVLPVATTAATDQPAPRGAIYHYVVTAVDHEGNESVPSTEASAVSTPATLVTLAVSALQGTVAGGGSYEMNASAALTAHPDPGHVFAGWSGAASGIVNPLSLLMDGDKSITASFAPDSADPDGDGLGNHSEIVVHGTNPNVADSDGDSLDDLMEITAGTNPLQVDTDNDGSPDNLDAFPLDPGETTDTDGDTIGNNADTDDDGDGVDDSMDMFPLDAAEFLDTDGDGIGNDADPDDDNDNSPDETDAFPQDPNETLDTDGDTIGNNADPDDDGDDIPDTTDAFPLDATESLDTDSDGLGNNADPDDDGDGVPDTTDAFPLDVTESVDTDLDNIGNNADTDDDGDGVPDATDAFPLDVNESTDTDGDALGNNTDPDDDNDGVADTVDAFPLDGNESVDTDGDAIGNNADPDDDGDGVPDTTDAFPLDVTESIDTDLDSIGNNADTDDDGDGVPDATDAFPLDVTESIDTDLDNIGNNSDTDDDGDGVPDATDAFPLDANESTDTDGDAIGNNADPDDDSDGVPDLTDAFPLDANESVDTDGDTIGNNADLDDDGDGVSDLTDAFPLDATESIDSDLDGIGNNADTDDDGDGANDTVDAFPLDPNESVDTDTDTIGNNADLDDDGDGVPDATDAFPLDSNESTDTDGDAVGNNADLDDDSDGVSDLTDAFPLDATESIDSDLDGIGNNADPDDDGDGIPDTVDAFPLDPNETTDTDGDTIGNNADPDDDGDGTPDLADAFPLDSAESSDTDGDAIGNNADPDDDNDGVPDAADKFPLDPGEASDTDGDTIGNNADPDDDGDGSPDANDAFPLDANETTDTDGDAIGNNADDDDDGDGFDDAFEITTGFDPLASDSSPDSVSSIRTAVEFRFNAASGVSYRIEASGDLTQWEVIEASIIGQGGVVTRFYSTENSPARYFRVRRN